MPSAGSAPDLAIVVKPADWEDKRTYDILANHFNFFTALEVNSTFSEPPTLDSYVKGLQGPNSTVFTARDSNSAILLGCGALRTFPDGIKGHDGRPVADAGEVRAMYTLPTARGRGVGAQILRRIELVAKEAGLHRLYLETGLLEGYAPARSLYAKAGFVECAPFGRYSEHPDLFCMLKEL